MLGFASNLCGARFDRLTDGANFELIFDVVRVQQYLSYAWCLPATKPVVYVWVPRECMSCMSKAGVTLNGRGQPHVGLFAVN